MFRLNDNYYHRKCYFEREQVPTQTVINNKMKPPLAKVYFKSMTPKLKVLAGLEPPMKGGGSDWYMPPNDILESRAVLKPVKKEHLKKLGFNAFDFFGEKLVNDHNRAMEDEKDEALVENDIKWKETINLVCKQVTEVTSKQESKNNTRKILQAFYEFTSLYSTSVNNVETILMDAAVKQIERVREGSLKKLMEEYETKLKKQATMMYDSYADRLAKEKARQKAEFIENVEEARTDLGNQLHDINVEKHVAIEKLRSFLECQNLACQIYVALKEREECKKEIDLAQHEHKKKVRDLKEQIAMHDFELRLEIEKEKKRHDFKKNWKIKICHVVKKFQSFVEYCLHMLPEHAEFFINMEKLMLLQLGQASENPSVESIFEPEPEFHTPVPKPHPFFLFCDKGFKPQLDNELCPKHCTSSASQLPVIVVNKRCIYAACDNFDVYSDRVTQYIHGRRGDDADFEDHHNYNYDVPVKYTSSQQLLELKLESSLMQVIQQKLPNIRELPIECHYCKIPYCFCSETHDISKTLITMQESKQISLPSVSSELERKIESRYLELAHEREPKWESYLDYVHPKKCMCAKTAKKHLYEHMPPYMRNMSKFEKPELPNYETCSVITLKKLVKEARGERSPPPEPVKVESKTRDVSTQYEDQEYELLCQCFSKEEIAKIFEALIKDKTIFDAEKTEAKFDTVDGGVTPTHLKQKTSSFATERAFSLRNLLDGTPELEEIFRKVNCKYD